MLSVYMFASYFLELISSASNIAISSAFVDDAQLFVTGRDVEEREMALMWSRETCQWTLSGTADEFKQSAARKAIIELLRQQGAMKPSAVAEELGKNRNTTKNLMLKMAEKNEIRGDGGLYWVSSPEQ